MTKHVQGSTSKSPAHSHTVRYGRDDARRTSAPRGAGEEAASVGSGGGGVGGDGAAAGELGKEGGHVLLGSRAAAGD